MISLRCLQVYFVSLLISYPQWNTKMSVDIYADISIANLQEIQYCRTKLKKISILNLQMDIHFDKLGDPGFVSPTEEARVVRQG